MKNKKNYKFSEKTSALLPIQYHKLEKIPKRKPQKWTIQNFVPSVFLNTKKMVIQPFHKSISKII